MHLHDCTYTNIYNSKYGIIAYDAIDGREYATAIDCNRKTHLSSGCPRADIILRSSPSTLPDPCLSLPLLPFSSWGENNSAKTMSSSGRDIMSVVPSTFLHALISSTGYARISFFITSNNPSFRNLCYLSAPAIFQHEALHLDDRSYLCCHIYCYARSSTDRYTVPIRAQVALSDRNI